MYTWPSAPVLVTVTITIDEAGWEAAPEMIWDAAEDDEGAEWALADDAED